MKLFITLIIITLSSQLFGQNGLLYTIIESDTVSVEKSGIEVFIVVKKDTIKFHNGKNLIYPKIEANNDVHSIIVNLKGENYEFFNMENSKLPPQIAMNMGPFYTSLFLDKTNMYISLKDKTDMFNNIPTEGLEKDIVKKQKKMKQLSVYYQQTTSISISVK